MPSPLPWRDSTTSGPCEIRVSVSEQECRLRVRKSVTLCLLGGSGSTATRYCVRRPGRDQTALVVVVLVLVLESERQRSEDELFVVPMTYGRSVILCRPGQAGMPDLLICAKARDMKQDRCLLFIRTGCAHRCQRQPTDGGFGSGSRSRLSVAASDLRPRPPPFAAFASFAAFA